MCDERAIEDLNLWRFYGRNGNGVAVHFEIENDCKTWDSFHLGKIYYGDFTQSALHDFLSHLQLSPHKDRLYPQVVPLLAFHKSDIYQSELEFRLLCHSPGGSLDRPNYPYEKRNYGLTFPIIRPKYSVQKGFGRYLMLPLANRFTEEHFFFEKAPRIRITKITLGFKYSSRQRDEILKVLAEGMQEERKRVSGEFRGVRHSILWSDYADIIKNGPLNSEPALEIHSKIENNQLPPLFEEFREVEVEISDLKGKFDG